MSLRPYQQRIVDDAMNEYTNYTRPFVVDAFQASGKSWMIAEIAKRVGKCLILCMNKELVEQDAEKIRAVGAECSIYSASCGEKVISNITVATIGSIYKHPEYCQHFNLVIVDEADQVPVDKKDSMYMKLFRQIKKPVMGWTGTAFRTAYNYSRLKNGDVVQSTVIKSLDKFNFWGKVVGGVTYQELLDEEFVSPIQYYVEDTNMSMLRVNSTGLDYTEDSLEKYGGANRMRLVQVVRGAVDVWKCKRVLVAVPNIEEAERVAEILRADGVRAERLHSQMNKKERTLLRREMGMLFQGSALFDSLSVLENVMFPLDMFSPLSYKDRKKRAQECLDRVNLIDAQLKYPAELSGGMQKRAAIARAISMQPKYLFCDEPNSGLDPKTSLVIDKLIHEITVENNMTTIINTHDMNSVMGIGENILYIYQGHKEWQGTSSEILSSNNQRLNDFIFASDFSKQLRKSFEEHEEHLP